MESGIDEVIWDLKCTNKAIDVWESSRASARGWREHQLSHFHAMRDKCLMELKEYKVSDVH